MTLLDVDNLRLDGNAITSTNANGNIDLDPAGSGVVRVLGANLQAQRFESAEFALGNNIFGTQLAFGASGYIGWNGTGSPGGADTSLVRDSAAVQRDTNGSGGLGFRLTGRALEASTAGSAAPNLLAVTESRKALTNEGATAEAYHTLPSAAAGIEFVFVCQDADGIRITANTGDTIRLEGTVSLVAGFVRSSAVGSCLILLAVNSTEWVATSITGAWTVDL